jgi:hypothetical protein
MINGFQEQTEPLTEYEETTLLPQLVRGLQLKVGKAMSVTNKAIIEGMNRNLGLKMTDARVRKLINHIRVHDLVPCLIATSQGYYIAESEQELRDYEESLLGREAAIRSVRLSIQRQRQRRYSQQKSLFNE